MVSIVSACINCLRTSNCSKIVTRRMFICVFTESALRFPLGVCIDMAEVAIGCIGLHFQESIHIVARCVNVRIDFNLVGIASGSISFPYCYCMIWLSSPRIFMYLLIVHIFRLYLSTRAKFIGTVLIQPLGVCIFSSISEVLRQPLGVWVHIYRTILILQLGVCIKIAPGVMSL